MLKVITGVMKSGKTKALIDSYNKSKDVLAIKPSIDTRTKDITSRDGSSIPCKNWDWNFKQFYFSKNVKKVLVDEFFLFDPSSLASLVNYCLIKNIEIEIYGLLKDYNDKYFPTSEMILSFAKSANDCKLINLEYLCEICDNAQATHHVLTEEPITGNIKIGFDTFKPVCKKCWKKNK